MNTYVLDHVFPPSSKQEDVYAAKTNLGQCFQGINCLFIATVKQEQENTYYAGYRHVGYSSSRIVDKQLL